MHHALVAGDVLLRGSQNPQPDEASCCASCLNYDGCTAWVYCPKEGGCAAGGAAANVTLIRRGSGELPAPTEAEQQRQLQLPYQGCRLLSIGAFRLRKSSEQILAQGPGIDFVSGGLLCGWVQRVRSGSVDACRGCSAHAAGWLAGWLCAGCGCGCTGQPG